MFCIKILIAFFPVVFGINTNCSTYSSCSCDLIGAGLIDLNGFKDGPNAYIELEGVGRSTYRFYPCGVTDSWGTGSCGKTATLCEYNVYADEYYSLGETCIFEISEAVAMGTDSYIVFMYSGGTEGRESYITVKCDTNNEFELINVFRNTEFYFEFKSPKACPIPVPAGRGGNAPAVFIFVILVIFLATVTYLVVGVMLMVFWKGARGFEIIPNLGFWKDLPFLFKDGVLFCFSCIPEYRSRIGGQKAYSSLK